MKKKKKVKIILLGLINLLVGYNLLGQEMVLNGDFESGNTHIYYSGTDLHISTATNWSSVANTSSDLFWNSESSCSFKAKNNKWRKSNLNHNGRYAGFGKGEDIQGSLTGSFSSSCTYVLEFKMAKTQSNYNCSNNWFKNADWESNSHSSNVKVFLKNANGDSKLVKTVTGHTAKSFTLYSTQFSLSSTEVGYGFDRIEFIIESTPYNIGSTPIFLDDVSIKPYNFPSSDFTVSSNSICIGESITTTASTSSVTHQWWFYKQGTSQGSVACNGASCLFTPTTAGTYVVKHQISTSCGTGVTEKLITVNPKTNVSFLNTGFCISETAGNLNYSPSGGTMTGTGIFNSGGTWKFNASIAGAGSHPITYTYTNSFGCVSSKTATITVDSESNVMILCNNHELCESSSPINIGGTPAGGTWSGNGVYYNSAAGSWQFDPSGNVGANVLTYTVSSSNGLCSNTASTTVYVDDPITANISYPFPDLCEGTTGQFSANITNSYSHNPTYSWSFPNGNPNSATGLNASTSFNSPGNYSVVFIGTNNCPTSTLSANITVVESNPNFEIITPDPICGTKQLQTNYTGSSPISWSGPGVNQYTGVLNNPSQDLDNRTITASIQNSCQDSHTKSFNQYKNKPISPDLFCSYDLPTQLVSDIAPGSWSITPATPALNTSTGEFNPTVAGPGTFTVTHNSICNRTDDIIVLEGGPQGTEHWPKHAFDYNEQDESGRAIVQKSDGSYFIIGTFTGNMQVESSQPMLSSNGGTDIFLAKYDDCGVVWSTSFGGSANETNPDIAIDFASNDEAIYISATIASSFSLPGGCVSCNLNPTSSEKGMIAKVDDDGNFIWATIPANQSSEINHFNAIDAVAGNIVVTGGFLSEITNSFNSNIYPAKGGGSDQDILAIRIVEISNSINSIVFNTIGSHAEDDGNDIAIEPGNQEVYITGYATELELPAQTIPMSPGGKEVFFGMLDQMHNWTTVSLYGGPNDDEGLGIDANNLVAITGYVEGDVEMGPGFMLQTSNMSKDVFVMELQLDGQVQWAQLGGSQFNIDEGKSVAIQNNEIAVLGVISDHANFQGFGAGISSSASSDPDMFVAIYDAGSGNGTSLITIPGMGSTDYGYSIAPFPNLSDFGIAGEFNHSIDIMGPLVSNAGTDMFAARYSQAANFFRNKEQEESLSQIDAKEQQLFRAYPNPMNNQLNIEVINAGMFDIEMLDLNGKTIFQENRLEGEYTHTLDLSAYAKGIYLLRMVNAEEVKTLKIIKQ